MGFGFNLIGFPILILMTFGLLLYFFATKKKIALKILAAIWGLISLVLILAVISDHYRTPIKLTKYELLEIIILTQTFIAVETRNGKTNITNSQLHRLIASIFL